MTDSQTGRQLVRTGDGRRATHTPLPRLAMKILYSRTQFWFGLKAGGSVAHTAGVLRGLSHLAQVEIISNGPIYWLMVCPVKS